MWITAELIDKFETKAGFEMHVQYATDDLPIPRTFAGIIQLSAGQDESTFKLAVTQQLADLNAADVITPEQAQLKIVVDAIPLGAVKP